MLGNLSFSRFKAYFRPLEPVRLPSYTGSALRGGLGHGMRRVRYGMKDGCTGCTARAECRYGSLYAYLFESPFDHPFIEPAHHELAPRLKRETYPQPFILDPPPGGELGPGEILSLPFTLVGKAISHFPFVACALTAMGAAGLGRGKGQARLEAVSGLSPSGNGDEAPIYHGELEEMVGPAEVADFQLVRKWTEESLRSPSSVAAVRLRFLTPFRYKVEGRLGRPLTFEILMKNLLRRFALLSVHSPLTFAPDHRGLLALASRVSTASSTLRWHQWERYSNRQKGWMNLDGFVGEIAFEGNMAPFLPYLRMGEFLNVGKDASFGLGKYELSFTAEPG